MTAAEPMHLITMPLQLQEIQQEAPLQMTRQQWDEAQGVDFAWAWTYLPGVYEHSDIFEGHLDSHLYVIPSSAFKAKGWLVSWSDLTKLSSFLEACTDSEKVTGESSSQQRRPQTTAEVPLWMQSLMGMEATETASAQSRGQDSSKTTVSRQDSQDRDEAEPDVPEEPDERLWQELEANRRSFASRAEEIDTQFRMSLLGGAWQVARTGRAVYGLRVDIKKNTALWDFASAFNLKMSQSFENNVYSEAGGQLLSKLWRMRLHQLSVAWETAGRPATFPKDQVDALELEQSDRQALDSLTGKAAKRGQMLLTLLP